MLTMQAAVSTLFNKQLELVGFCIDTQDGIAKAMMEHENIYLATSPSLDKIFQKSNLFDRLNENNQAQSEFQSPDRLVKWANKLNQDMFADEDTVRLLADKADLFKHQYKINCFLGILKGLRRLYTAINEKDGKQLKELLWYQNKNYRAIFEEETGVKLGKTDKSMRIAIDDWMK